MAILTITGRGQVTFRKDVLRHLGVKPGEKVTLDLLPDGQAALRAAQPSGTMDDFLGLLAGRTKKIATIQEMREAAARGWAARR